MGLAAQLLDAQPEPPRGQHRVPRCLSAAAAHRSRIGAFYSHHRTATYVASGYNHVPFDHGNFRFDLGPEEVARRVVNFRANRAVLDAFEFFADHPHLETGLLHGYDAACRSARRLGREIELVLPERVVDRLSLPRAPRPNGKLPNQTVDRFLAIDNHGSRETFRVKIILPLPQVERSGGADIFLAGLGLKAEASFREHGKNNGDSHSSMIRESLATGNVVVIVDAPGLSKSEGVSWKAGEYYKVFVEKMLPEVFRLCREDFFLRDLRVNFIGHSQGATVPIMAYAHFGANSLLAQLGRERITITAIAPALRIFADLDPSLAVLLSLDPLLNRHLANGNRVRTLPYFVMGPVCDRVPDSVLRALAASQPLLGADLSPDIMRNFFGWAGGNISYMMIQELMYDCLVNGYPPYLHGSLPVDSRVKIVTVHAIGDPWAPPEGFSDIYWSATLVDRRHLAMYELDGDNLATSLPLVLAGINNPEVWSMAVVLNKACRSGHLAAAMRGEMHRRFMPPILQAVRDSRMAA